MSLTNALVSLATINSPNVPVCSTKSQRNTLWLLPRFPWKPVVYLSVEKGHLPLSIQKEAPHQWFSTLRVMGPSGGDEGSKILLVQCSRTIELYNRIKGVFVYWKPWEDLRNSVGPHPPSHSLLLRGFTRWPCPVLWFYWDYDSIELRNKTPPGPAEPLACTFSMTFLSSWLVNDVEGDEPRSAQL